MQNDETEPFERHLKRQTLRPIPTQWREEILSAAKAAQPARRSPVKDRSFLSVLNDRVASLLWPHPVAWAGLAAVWILIFALNFSIRDKAPAMAEKASPPSPTVVAELRQQQRLYVELLGANDPVDADRQKIFAPGPRSERVAILDA